MSGEEITLGPLPLSFNMPSTYTWGVLVKKSWRDHGMRLVLADSFSLEVVISSRASAGPGFTNFILVYRYCYPEDIKRLPVGDNVKKKKPNTPQLSE